MFCFCQITEISQQQKYLKGLPFWMLQSFHEWRMVATVPSNKDSINFLASIHIQFVVVVVASASAFVVAVVVTIVQV